MIFSNGLPPGANSCSSLNDALVAVEHLERAGARIHGWEGWLRHADGALGHSALFQGTTDIGDLSVAEAAALVSGTMRYAHAEWRSSAEAGKQLLFCITYDAEP